MLYRVKIIANGELYRPGPASFTKDDWGYLAVPRCHINPKARFWFTEAGWRKCGLRLCRAIRKRGLGVIVKKRKNPPASSVMYRDHWQVAIIERDP